MFTNNFDCERRKVVKDHCFPDEKDSQVKLVKLKSSHEVQEVLYGQNDSIRKNTFVLTMLADDLGNLFYLICTITYEIV